MKLLIRKALIWKLTIAKGCMFTFVGMGTLLCATMQNWDAAYVSTMCWWNWTVLIVSLLVNGANSVMSFIDRTWLDDKQKDKDEDTKMFTKSGDRSIA